MASNQVKASMSAADLLALGTRSAQQGSPAPSHTQETDAARATPLQLNETGGVPAKELPAIGQDVAPLPFEFGTQADWKGVPLEQLAVLHEALGGYEMMLDKAHATVQPTSMLNPRMDEVEAKKASLRTVQIKCRVLQREIADILRTRK